MLDFTVELEADGTATAGAGLPLDPPFRIIPDPRFLKEESFN